MTATRSSADRASLRPPALQAHPEHSPCPQPHCPFHIEPPRPHSPFHADRPADTHERSTGKGGHQPFVLTDPVAFRYLEEDSSTHVLQRRRELRGYECYIVEQWTTSRVHPTFVITNYTGDDTDVVVVDVLSVPTDEHAWSPRLRVYFRALNQYHARRRETPLGVLMVTNLSGFPSSLAIIPVPDGDVRRHRFDFFVNEDLKRLGCSGRVGLTLAQPAASTVAKFHQLYRTSDKNDIYKSVVELIKLCQSALVLFDQLEIDYSDGLLCDVTERAINDWWAEIGSDHYNVEPHDGILGPTTVAGLLGLLMGARNRLHAMNAPVSKDAFDVEGMKRGIGAFQKQQRIPRTRRLDRRTLDRLHKASQKAAEKERWAVPKAVKSTVAELSGRGGEMIGDLVGRRDRAGIAEVETVDMDRFVQLVYGDGARWLWLGKPMKKSKVADGAARVPRDVHEAPALHKGLVFKSDEHGGYTWTTHRKSSLNGMPAEGGRKKEQEDPDHIMHSAVDERDGLMEECGVRPSLDATRSTMFTRASTLKDKPKAGLEKVKGAVGFRGHKRKPSVDEAAPRSGGEKAGRRPLLIRSHTSPLSSPSSPELGSRQDVDGLTPGTEEQSNGLQVVRAGSRPTAGDSRSLMAASSSRLVSHESFPAEGSHKENRHVPSEQRQRTGSQEESTGGSASADGSMAGSIYHGMDLNEALPRVPGTTEAGPSTLLKRTASYSQYVEAELQCDHGGLAPRHLSFSLAEESVLTWDSIGQEEEEEEEEAHHPSPSARAQLAEQQDRAAHAKRLRRVMTGLQCQTATWTWKALEQLQEMLERLDHGQDTLDGLHRPRSRRVRELHGRSGAVQRQEREGVEEGVKEMETRAARLEYEIDGLRGKVEDVEAGVAEFEKSVGRVEGRVGELEREAEKGGRCAVQ